MKTDWEIGDWCFCDFEIQQITNIQKYVDGNAITVVSDGYTSHSGKFLNDSCFPLDLTIKKISSTYKSYWDKVHNYGSGLDFPKLRHEIVNMWCECCEDIEDKEKLENHIRKLQNWFLINTSTDQEIRMMKLNQLDNARVKKV